jgi:hemoglobin
MLHLQGAGVARAREEQFNYLCGSFGGPEYYVMKHRHSRLNEIHAHVAVGPEMRDLWLKCMKKAITRRGIQEDLAAQVIRHFGSAAETVRNMD